MKKIISFLFVLLALFTLASCNEDEILDELNKTEEIPTEIQELVFEDMTFEYDGTVKSLPELELPEGYTAEYLNNEQTNIGGYTVRVRIKNADGVLVATLKAKIIIVESLEETAPEETLPSDTVEIEGISVSSEGNVRNVEVGSTLKLTATVYPTTASQEVVWSSSNEEVATVDQNGLVTALSVGNVNIVATSKENSDVSQKYSLIIEEAPEVIVTPTSVTVEANDGVTTIKVGQTVSLSATVLPKEANQAVIWKTSDNTIATVKRGEVTALKAGEVTITATSKDFDTVYGSITLTIEQADKPVVSGEWAEMPFSTHDDYVNGDDDTKIKVVGVVTHVLPLKDGAVSYFIQNGVDGYYVYAQDAVTYPVELGKVYEVGGYKKYYRGLNEIVNVEYFVDSTENIEFEYVSLEGKNPTDLNAMAEYQGAYVTANGTFVSGTTNTKAFNVIVNVGGYEATLRVDPSYMSSEEFDSICAVVSKSVAGVSVEFSGFMTAFGYGTPAVQIQIVKASDLVVSEASAEDILEACLEKITIDDSVGYSKNEITIPTVVEGFEDVTITWSSNSENINVETGAVIHAATDVTVTLSVTLTYKNATLTHDYQVVVVAEDTNVYEVVASLDLEDASKETNYGCSATKPGYAEGVITLGTPAHNWMLRNALIANSSSDRFEGTMGIRAKSGASAEATARIEIKEEGEYNVVEFAAGTYGNHVLGTKIRVEYTTDDGQTWIASDVIITLNAYEMETFRVKLPEGVKRVAIVVVENSGKTINIDSIKLMK